MNICRKILLTLCAGVFAAGQIFAGNPADSAIDSNKNNRIGNNTAKVFAADSIVAECLERLEYNPDDRETLHRLANRYFDLGDTEQARTYGQRLLDMADRDSRPDDCRLEAHIILGRAAQESDRGTICFEHFENARAIAERLQNHDALMTIYNALGSYYLFVSDDTYAAISYYFQALEEAKTNGSQIQYAATLSNIAGAYFVREDTSGLRFAEEAIEIAKEYGEKWILFCSLVHAANFYLMGDIHLDRAENAIAELERMDDESGGIQVHIALLKAQLCERKGDMAAADRYYKYVMANMGNAFQSMTTMVYLKYAGLLRAQNRLREATELMEHCMGMIDETDVAIYKARILNELALCCRDAGQYDRALTYAFEHQRYRARLADDARERSLNEARIKHDIYSREQQISRQQMVIVNNRYKMAVLAGALAVALAILGVTYCSKRKTERLYRAIVLQNRDYMQREKMLLEQIKSGVSAGRPSQIPPPPAEKLNELMSRFTAVMMERRLFADSSLTLAAVADELGSNRTYLSKAINEITGKNFTQVVNDYRIREAIAQISDTATDRPLKQIAADVGFSSLSTFYSVFQATTGMTPARYRAKLLEIRPSADE